jgi:hypothetical protein
MVRMHAVAKKFLAPYDNIDKASSLVRSLGTVTKALVAERRKRRLATATEGG